MKFQIFFLPFFLLLNVTFVSARNTAITAEANPKTQTARLPGAPDRLHKNGLQRFFRIVKKKCKRAARGSVFSRNFKAKKQLKSAETNVHPKAKVGLGLGIAALLMLLLGNAFVLEVILILGVVLGIIGFFMSLNARRIIKESGGFYTGKGTAIAGIVFGAVAGLLPIAATILLLLFFLIAFGGF